MPTVIIYKKDELTHHGILGQKWGKKNGPPYPLDASDHSASEKKAGWKKSLGGGRNESEYGSGKNNRKPKKTSKVNISKKQVAAGVAIVAAIGLTAYAVKSGKVSKLTKSGIKMVNDGALLTQVSKKGTNGTRNSSSEHFKKVFDRYDRGETTTLKPSKLDDVMGKMDKAMSVGREGNAKTRAYNEGAVQAVKKAASERSIKRASTFKEAHNKLEEHVQASIKRLGPNASADKIKTIRTEARKQQAYLDELERRSAYYLNQVEKGNGKLAPSPIFSEDELLAFLKKNAGK